MCTQRMLRSWRRRDRPVDGPILGTSGVGSNGDASEGFLVIVVVIVVVVVVVCLVVAEDMESGTGTADADTALPRPPNPRLL